MTPGLIWDASFLFIAEGLEAVAPDGITFLPFVIGFATLSCVPGARRAVHASDRLGIAWLGVVWLAFPMSMFPHAEQHVSSALTGMLNGAIPLNAEGVGYVIEGALRMQLAGQPERIVRAGESFYESPSDIPAVSANASATAPARFLACFTCDKDTPTSVPVPPAPRGRRPGPVS